jgi:hypothetical protein
MTACIAGCTMAVNLMTGRMLRDDARHQSPAYKSAGWAAALDEFEHQAAHWDTPDHGETGHLIAQALRAAVDIARTGGLHCDGCGRQQPGVTSASQAVATRLRPGARRSSAA